ncbi:MAG: NYN domain-containing protein [Ottowia sp.]
MSAPAEKKLAVLIDADNASASAAAELMGEIAKYGIASVKRVYGDWSSPLLAGWQKILLQHALTPVQQFAYTKGKDATDMSLIIDAMDLLHSGRFDGFCLISSDSDFTPLASRIRAQGLTVYGLGRKTTPQAFRNACDKFIYVENLVDAAPPPGAGAAASPAPAPQATAPRQPIEGALKTMLYTALKNTAEESGWASAARIGGYLNQTHTDFDPRSYGYSKLSSMLMLLKGVQSRHDNSQMYFRKIPWLELARKVREAHQKFQDENGSADIHALETHLAPHLNVREYGFADLCDLLRQMHSAQVEGDRLTLLPPAARAENKAESA